MLFLYQYNTTLKEFLWYRTSNKYIKMMEDVYIQEKNEKIEMNFEVIPV